MKRLILLISLCALCCTRPAEEAVRTLNIKDFGAVGDGVTLCTDALNGAIDSCSRSGGGVVLVPEGTFLTETVFLRDSVELRLDKGAVILGVDDPERYGHYAPDHDMSRYDSGNGTANANCSSDPRWTRALILGVGLKHIAVTGEGTVDGRHVFDPMGEESMRGPHGILLAECRDVRLEGIRITRASNYAFLGYALEDASFTGIHITEGWDGIHIRGGKNVEISHCRFETGDDAIAGGYWEGMHIHGCDINSTCNGIRMIQPADGLEIDHCLFHGPGTYPHRTYPESAPHMLFGISLEPGGWGAAPGILRNVHIHDVQMDCISSPLSISIRPECEAHDLLVEDLTATHVEKTFSPAVCWNDTGFTTAVFRNISLSR